MAFGETELEMVRRHVRQGSAHVARQHEIVAELRAAHYPTRIAEEVLGKFEDLQAEHEAHLKRLTRLA